MESQLKIWDSPYLKNWIKENGMEFLNTGMMFEPSNPLNDPLLDALEGFTGIKKEWIYVGAGSSHVLQGILSLPRWKTIFLLEPDFGLYRFISLNNGKNIISLKVVNFTEALLKLQKNTSSKNDLLCFSSPRWYSGELMSLEILIQILSSFNGYVLIDEAYIDFSDRDKKNDVIKYCLKEERIIVVRSFSKGWWLPGLRIGYAVSAILPDLFRIGSVVPHSISAPSMLFLINALNDSRIVNEIEKGQNFIISLRRKVDNVLNDIPTISIIHSQGPFGIFFINGNSKIDIKKFKEYHNISWPKQGVKYPIYNIENANKLIDLLY